MSRDFIFVSAYEYVIIYIMSKKTPSYSSSVDYSIADPVKILAQKEGQVTSKNLPFGFKEVEGTRGESAYVFDMGDRYGALVQEGLGTKSLIAQAVYDATGVSHFANIATDTVAAIVNDLITVGATAAVVNAYWSAQSYEWLSDPKVSEEFIQGWRKACDAAGATWGGGETQSLPDIIEKGALEFAGSGFGIIDPKDRLTVGKDISVGDVIILFESAGIHANGVSLARSLADALPDGYQTKLPSGGTYGEALLTPSIVYAKVIQAIFEADVDIHYMAHITGHGWRKLMRHTKSLTYRIKEVPPVPEVLQFIQKSVEMTDEEAYGTFNMGAGYAIFVPVMGVEKVLQVSQEQGIKAYTAGVVEEGEKQVIIEPLNITYKKEDLAVRA